MPFVCAAKGRVQVRSELEEATNTIVQRPEGESVPHQSMQQQHHQQQEHRSPACPITWNDKDGGGNVVSPQRAQRGRSRGRHEQPGRGEGDNPCKVINDSDLKSAIGEEEVAAASMDASQGKKAEREKGEDEEARGEGESDHGAGSSARVAYRKMQEQSVGALGMAK
eukprot:scaffold78599_cov15-Tisochrysis_lutea.AAC.1